MVERCRFGAHGLESPIGWLPDYADIDMSGLESTVTPEIFAEAQKIDTAEWHRELLLQDELYIKLYSALPKDLIFQRELLMSRL
jgi:phosphoenolpyruvate carboxykinase (GTP)